MAPLCPRPLPPGHEGKMARSVIDFRGGREVGRGGLLGPGEGGRQPPPPPPGCQRRPNKMVVKVGLKPPPPPPPAPQPHSTTTSRRTTTAAAAATRAGGQRHTHTLGLAALQPGGPGPAHTSATLTTWPPQFWESEGGRRARATPCTDAPGNLCVPVGLRPGPQGSRHTHTAPPLPRDASRPPRGHQSAGEGGARRRDPPCTASHTTLARGASLPS